MSTHSDLDFILLLEEKQGRNLDAREWFYRASLRWRAKLSKVDGHGGLAMCPLFSPSGNAESIVTAEEAVGENLYLLFNSRQIESLYASPAVYTCYATNRELALRDSNVRQNLLDLFWKDSSSRLQKWTGIERREYVLLKYMRREIEWIVAGLALQKGILCTGIYNRIEALAAQNEWALGRPEELGRLVDDIGRLRMRAQSFHDSEHDMVWMHPAAKQYVLNEREKGLLSQFSIEIKMLWAEVFQLQSIKP